MMRETLADVAEPSKRPMDLAFAEAEAAGLLGEVPIGAVVVSASGEVLAQAGNRTLAAPRSDRTCRAARHP